MKRVLLVLVAAACLGATSPQNEFSEAARDIDTTIANGYAYLDKLPDERLPQSEVLSKERDAVHDTRSLLAYAEKRIASLADHHAMTGSSFSDSWAVVPTYADLWIVKEGDRYVVDAVREASPAEAAGISTGDTIIAVDRKPIDRAISEFWGELGLSTTPARVEYAARVLVAGRRDRPRRITIRDLSGEDRELVLHSMYDQKLEAGSPINVCSNEEYTVVRFNNRLGDFATISAFDQAMRALSNESTLILDLRDTPSGGNTTVARGILGWFVTQPRGYQIHNRPVEERQTGISRQWIEQVLPRAGMYRSELPIVLVGRWTGSMGEGIAIGFAAMGAEVRGTMMAGLNGSVDDLRVGDTDLFVKLPTERLMTLSGLPRELFVPDGPIDVDQVPGSC
ncbi:S41 family peptidase [Erythrobacter sp. JK5]|uniref:S41 family peptidase n=1 Tax=Erythrobacter sp. JK5 TaxID=2829500 RepID=UPI001BAB0FEE|nr:S41 family peptidase [Erythrobacter sp. JK5]QUL37613.1 hypothetical protein KDC96_14910 [Erythrobacter sp. JK5]